MLRLLVYTCVFGNYDRIFPPIVLEPGVRYVVITDDAELNVPGWHSHVVDRERFASARAANRYYKMLGHRMFGEFDASAYVDGNVRVRDSLCPLLERLLKTGAALGVYPHPIRSTVAEEVETCITAGKIGDSDKLRSEFREYLAEGFPDDQGLIEATILLKNHGHTELDSAMQLWWSLFQRFHSRDQISLPYVLWKTALPFRLQAQSFRVSNSPFGIYPHLAALNVSPMYAYVCARAYDSSVFRAAKSIWHGKWALQRRFRRSATRKA